MLKTIASIIITLVLIITLFHKMFGLYRGKIQYIKGTLV